jgi:bifunctional non-homologous end joining protein LigD
MAKRPAGRPDTRGERPQPPPNAAREQWTFAGRRVAVSHLSKLFWPAAGLTKGDLLNYYRAIGPVLLPYIKDRPLVMKPFPNGAGGASYYRQNLPATAPDWLQRFQTESTSVRRTKQMPVVNDLAALIWLVNQAAIEIHPWLSRIDRPERPDVIVFDLDVTSPESFPLALAIADRLRLALEHLGLQAFPKTSGGDGLHVYVPVEREYSYRETRAWAQRLASGLASEDPTQVTTESALQGRRAKVLIDYAQNGFGKTTVAPYSVRPRLEATVSAPLTWEEVQGSTVRPQDFRLQTMSDRLARSGDLWQPLLGMRQRLPHLTSY